jgi:hypothetical protein
LKESVLAIAPHLPNPSFVKALRQPMAQAIVLQLLMSIS